VAVARRYGLPGLRTFSDIDLLVAPGDFDRAREALRSLGYEEASRGEISSGFSRPRAGPLELPIDLHRDLGYARQFGFRIEDMLGRAERSRGVPILSAEDEILSASAHAARHRMRCVGRTVADVAVVALTSRVDWPRLVERAREYGVAAATWCALMSAGLALGAPVPAEVIDQLRPGPAREAWLRLWLDFRRLSPYRLSRRGSGALGRRAAMLLLWPALSDGLGEGLAFVALYSIRMLGTRVDSP
jgi:hypothetical protein